MKKRFSICALLILLGAAPAKAQFVHSFQVNDTTRELLILTSENDLDSTLKPVEMLNMMHADLPQKIRIHWFQKLLPNTAAFKAQLDYLANRAYKKGINVAYLRPQTSSLLPYRFEGYASVHYAMFKQRTLSAKQARFRSNTACGLLTIYRPEVRDANGKKLKLLVNGKPVTIAMKTVTHIPIPTDTTVVITLPNGQHVAKLMLHCGEQKQLRAVCFYASTTFATVNATPIPIKGDLKLVMTLVDTEMAEIEMRNIRKTTIIQ